MDVIGEELLSIGRCEDRGNVARKQRACQNGMRGCCRIEGLERAH